MYSREDKSVSVIGVNRTPRQRSAVSQRRDDDYASDSYEAARARRRRISAREARKRKKRKRMIRLYTRLAVFVGGVGLLLFLGISLVSMAFSAISALTHRESGRPGIDILEQNTPVAGNNMGVGNGGNSTGNNTGNNAGSNGEGSNGTSNGGESSNGHISSDEDTTGKPFLGYGDKLNNDGVFVVCIDPGHGGNDVGCVGLDNSYEKDDTLKLAEYLAYSLEAEGVKVIRTRSTDVWVTLEDRPAYANEHKADLLISLHRNIYSEDQTVSGFEAWINSKDSANSEELAGLIMNGLEGVGISKNRGVKKGSQASATENYAVNAGSVMPSVLLEMGFMSSPTDNQLYKTNLKLYAKAIAQAIIQWSQGKQY